MKLFLDANILVSVLNKEYPVFTFSSRILSLSGNKRFEIFTSPLCLAIAFYFAEKKHSTKLAKTKISTLCDHINIGSNPAETVYKSLMNPSIHDFEDVLEYYSALDSGCNCIITENTSDFYFSKIEVLNSEFFCQKYLL